MVTVIPKTIMFGIEKDNPYSDSDVYFMCFKNGNSTIKSKNMSFKEVNEKYGFVEKEMLKLISKVFV